MMTITLVKKILKDGSPCKKCGDVLTKLEENDQMRFIDNVVVADERDEKSIGMLLAQQYDVDRAPFFIIESETTDPIIYTIYMKFVKEVLNQKIHESEELKEIMDNNQDLDFI